MRIYQTLPDRIKQWKATPSVAESHDRKKLEEIEKKKQSEYAKLQKLNQDFEALENIIKKSKTLVLPDDSSDDDEEDSVEMTIHCVSCGANIQVNTAIRHMERCYNKIEAQTSFASKFKSLLEDDTRLFCDFHNAKEGTFCKRLKVLCPEHNPDPKVIGDSEVKLLPVHDSSIHL